MAAREGGRGNRGRRSGNQVTLDMFRELQEPIQHLTEVVTQGTNIRRDGSVHGFDRAREVEDEVNQQFNGGSDGSSDERSNFGRPNHHNERPPWWDDCIVNALQHSKEYGVYVQILEFDGEIEPDDFLDWLDNIDNYFD
ncbi:hypothetical protein Acr_00g0016680 [Actinidia rufa]|uniref:Uncharacterized protein n=1 Tax=Actinidia rufa TaxID=165716 RepID=A0A7J0DB83_9ERIC|nr:hypothetical protein Acr_00g0016680 [Actinidia rufa]